MNLPAERTTDYVESSEGAVRPRYHLGNGTSERNSPCLTN